MFSDIKEEAFLTLIKSLNTEIKDIIIKTYDITYEKNCKTKEDKLYKTIKTEEEIIFWDSINV